MMVMIIGSADVPLMGHVALVGIDLPIATPKTLPEPAMLYQYGGKDDHKDTEAFNKHLNEIRSMAILYKDKRCGWYDQTTDEFYSRGESAIIHEQGHRLDLQILGNPSVQSSFVEEASKEPSIQELYSDLRAYYPNDIEFYMELYATLWEIAEGNINNIHPSIKMFYTNEWVWDR